MSLALLLGTELAEDVAAGHSVFGISAAGPYVDRVEDLGVQHVPVAALTRSWSLRSDIAAFFELARVIRRLRLDVLHTHTPKAGVMGRIAGRLAGVPVVVNTCHGLWARPEDKLLKRIFVYGLEGLAVRFSDFELFQNAEDAYTLRRFLEPNRWRVVGNGVDLQRFQPDPEGRARVRAEWGITDDQVLVGTIGRRVREKGLAEFAAAAHRLGDKAVFVWVGPKDDTDQATEVPHRDAIRFIDERADMPAVYSALDVFVLASYREGFSRASMEAAACGLPMVLTDIRGCREIGNDGEQLLLVKPQDGAALTAGIDRLLTSPALRQELGAAAHERAHTEFDQRRIAQMSLESYVRVAELKGLPWSTARDDPLTVLHVLPHDQDRGAQVYAGQLRDALRDDPQQRHLVVTLFDSPDAAARADIKLSVPGGLLRRGVDPRAVRRLRRLIKSEQVGMVVAHGGEALKYVIPAAGGVPTVYYKVGLSSAEIARPWHKRLYRALSARASRVVGVSQAVADQVSELLNVRADRTAVIPNGRDPERYRPLGDDDQAVEPPRLIWVGKLETGKRPGLFLDVVEQLRDRGLAFSAAIVGDGPLRASLESRASAMDVESLGVRTDVPELLRTSAVLVMTSAADTEGMPGVIIEAGLSGLPVVSTTAAGVSDVVVDGQTGAVIGTDSAVSLADRVAELLMDNDLRQQLGTAARARCEEQFTVAATARAWSTLAASSTGQQDGSVASETGENL
ncbi:MAG: glycosyltransferase [Brooklawnia sp.]|jgi:glycosyltransferase involved in cell wall biosynthesis